MNTDQYIEAHTDPEDGLLHEIVRYSALHLIGGQMVSGHVQGRVLSMLSRMIRPERILEIGTFTGYATLCLAEGLQENGRIDTIEANDEIVPVAARFFAASPLKDKIVQYTGDALQVIPTLGTTYDLVFIDAEKRKYEAFYDAVFPLLRPGGFLIADNVLWYDKASQQPDPRTDDKSLPAIRAFNDRISADPRIMKVILPVRDGLLVLQRLA